MEVNGKPVLVSGNTIIFPGDHVTIDMPWGKTHVKIADGIQRVGFAAVSGVFTLELIGITAPLGAAANIEIPVSGGVAKLRMFIHTVDDGTLLLNYSVVFIE